MIGRFRAAALIAGCVIGSAAGLAADTVREATLIPQTVYVGDRARLVVGLDPAAAGLGGPLVLDQRESLPKTTNVHIHRVEIERRLGQARAVIDFTAFAPGDVVLPPIELGAVRLSDLRVRIASVLAPGMTELAPPEPPLAAPGTYLLIYGTVFLLLLSAALALLVVLRGLPWISAYLERRRRGLAARSLRRVLERLEEEGSSMDGSAFLTILFDELRSYLTYRTGRNCHALTAREFPLALKDEAAAPRLSDDDLAFLEALFRRGDEVRFGAAPVSRDELRSALRGVGALLDKTEAAPC